MANIEELKAERIKKMNMLREVGINPYPASLNLPGKRIHVKEARERLSEVGETVDEETVDVEIKEEGKFNNKSDHHQNVILAGRIVGARGAGKIVFIDLSDESGKFQVVLKSDVLVEDKIKFFIETVDVGDFYAFVGKLFITSRGEKSLECMDYQILAKSLLPMPTLHYGLENEEESLRKRYLSMALDPEMRGRFYRKAKFWKVVREFLESRDFIEVDTPTIEVTTGGAEARPFKTYHNDYDMPVYMRIDVGELWQKRLLAGGFEKTYQIGKAYRNEGTSPNHLQEFTNCEFYWSYADYNDGMKLIEELYIEIAKKVYGRTSFEIGKHKFDLSDEWRKIDYRQEVLDRTGVDVYTSSEEEIKNKLKDLGVTWDGDGRERLTDTLWKYCRKEISGPAFLVNHPAFMSQLSKHNEGGFTSQVFQPIIAGAEAGKGFSELNDPSVQRANFDRQAKLLAAGDEEAMMPDYSFVEMLEHGMPPAFGYGFGERMFAFFEGLPIREVQLFPLVKPKK
jgi:lysyl-tRNA synthetase, class II